MEYFSMKEAAKRVGVTKNTLFRWEKQNKIPPPKRDRNGWRVYAAEDIPKILVFKNKIIDPNQAAAL